MNAGASPLDFTLIVGLVVAGLAFGLAYFWAVWRTSVYFARRGGWAVPAALTLARIGAAVALAIWLARLGAIPLLAGTLGFVLARSIAFYAGPRTR